MTSHLKSGCKTDPFKKKSCKYGSIGNLASQNWRSPVQLPTPTCLTLCNNISAEMRVISKERDEKEHKKEQKKKKVMIEHMGRQY